MIFCLMFLIQEFGEIPKLIKNNFYFQQLNFGINYLSIHLAESFPSHSLQLAKRNSPIHTKLFQLSIKINNRHHIDLSFIIKSVSFASVFLTKLCLKNINLSASSMLLIKQANWKFVRKAQFINTSITWQGVKEIIKFNWKYIRILSLSKNPIKNKGIEALCNIDWPNLRHLYLQQCKLDNNSMKIICKGLISNLFYLNMRDNYIDKNCFKYLVTANISNLRQFLYQSQFIDRNQAYQYTPYSFKLPFQTETITLKQGRLRMVNQYAKRLRNSEWSRLKDISFDDEDDQEL